MTIDKAFNLRTKGEAVVSSAFMSEIEGCPQIAVTIKGTATCIAICGSVGADDEEESRANAQLIAHAWNWLVVNGGKFDIEPAG